MIFIETQNFTEDIQGLMSDESYAEFQQVLANNPELGALIQGTGGLRKIRWQLPGRGKRGGARVIYFWHVSELKILLLFVYAKGEKDTLTADDKKQLRRIVEQYCNEQ